MDFFTVEVLILDSVGSQIPIGQALLTIKSQLLDMCSVWDSVSSHGSIRSSRQFLSPLERLTTEGLLRQDVKLFGFIGCLGTVDFLCCKCHQQDQPLCLLITNVLSNYHGIQSSMNEPSMWVFTVTTYNSWLKTRPQTCSMFLPRIRLQTFSPSLLVLINLSNSEDSLVLWID